MDAYCSSLGRTLGLRGLPVAGTVLSSTARARGDGGLMKADCVGVLSSESDTGEAARVSSIYKPFSGSSKGFDGGVAG